MVGLSTSTTSIKDVTPSSSSSTLSRPSILRPKTSSDSSLNSNESKISPTNITFAPLPVIERRKRRSNRPIGLAGRAELLRKSQRPLIIPENTYEVEEGYVPPREDDDIPLPDIGKLVKGFWRSISRGARSKNGLTADCQEGGADEEKDAPEGSVWMEEVTWSPTLEFAPTPFSLQGPIQNTQGNTSSSAGTFLEKLEGINDTENGGKIRRSEEHRKGRDGAITVSVT